MGTHWIASCVNGDNVTYFDSIRVEYIPNEIQKSHRRQNVETNTFKMKENDSIMFEYSCIRFIGFML